MNIIKDQLDILFESDTNAFLILLTKMTQSFPGNVYLVGGAVRDKLMGNLTPKDYDFVITKIDLESLAKLLIKYIPKAKINEVGKSFGVIKLEFNGEEYDFAIPRLDVDRNNVQVNKDIDIKADLSRRDFVINAGAWNIKTEFTESNIISPEGYNVVQDIKNGIIRAVGDPRDRFREDPLRMLRAIQFAARFGFTIEPTTLKAIQENVDLLTGVSAERFYEEFNKAWTKGKADTGVFFKLLNETHLGMVMFGKDFSPVPVDTSAYQGHERFLVQAIAAFLTGGNYEKLILKTDEQDIIKVSRWFYYTIKNGLSVESIKSVAKFGQYFPVILKAFAAIDSKTHSGLSNKMSELIGKPLVPKVQAGKQETWELPVTGGELMELAKELGLELKGKAIGETTLKLIKAYQDGSLTVSKDENESKESIKKALKSFLTEHYLNESTRLEILQTRMSNIFYK